jgi:hypothetical protein
VTPENAAAGALLILDIVSIDLLPQGVFASQIIGLIISGLK